MANKLMIIMVNTDPTNSSELGAPFFQATVAAAMDYEVEVILTARAGELAKKGVAEKLFVKEGSSKSVYDFIKDAHEAGAKFKVCTPTLDLWGDDLIPEIDETVGGAYVIEQAMDDEVVTFTY
jgi:predicted peroxiredoxin